MIVRAWELIRSHPLIVAVGAMAVAVAAALIVVMEILEGLGAAPCLNCRPTTPPDQTLEYLELLFVVLFCVFAFAAFLISASPRDTVD